MGGIHVPAAASGRCSRRSVLLATGGLILAGCSERERPTIQTAEGDSPASRLRAILERRTKALADGDEAAYLADLDPASTELVERERMVFANLRKFEFDDLRYVFSGVTERPDGNGGTAIQPVIRIAKLTADAGPGDVAPAESFSFRVVDKGGKTVVTDIVPATDESMREHKFVGPPANAPWLTDELTVVKAGADVWLAADTSVRDLDRYAEVAEEELGVVRKLWGDRPAFPGHVLFFTRDRENFLQWFDNGARGGIGRRALGVQNAMLGVTKNGQFFQDKFAASRIVVNLGAIEAHRSSPRRTIRHELTHAVTARAMLAGGVLQSPRWAVEGFARYTETVGDAGRTGQIRALVADGVRSGKFRDRLPNNDGFYGDDVIFNYDLGATPFIVAERVAGRDAAVELYATAIDTIDAGGQFMNFPVFDSIAQRIFSMSGGAFRQRWLNFVRNGG